MESYRLKPSRLGIKLDDRCANATIYEKPDDFGCTGTDHESNNNTDEDPEFKLLGDSRSVSEGEEDDVSNLEYMNGGRHYCRRYYKRFARG